MRVKRAIWGFLAITVLYLLALVWIDTKNDVFNEVPRLLSIFPVLLGISFLSYAIRYLRWLWLLNRAGHNVPFLYGFLAYLSGFAFTATPGKVGELVRVRYFSALAVPAWRVFAAFVCERALDLSVVLSMAALLFWGTEYFYLSALFVCIVLGGLILVGAFAREVVRFSSILRLYQFRRLSRLCQLLGRGLSGCKVWLGLQDIFLAVGLGFLAWGAVAYSFVCLLRHLEIEIDMFQAFGIYPLAMLAGAASMLPGGVGSTEAAIVALMHGFSTPVSQAALAAVGIRVASLWFSIICGFLSVLLLERRLKLR